MNEHIICLDIGDARTGIAVSDSMRMIATPLEVVPRIGWGPDVKHIVEVCRRYDTTLVVSGLPLNMDGSEGFQAKKVRQFCEQLEKAGLTVYYQDERLTTVTAQNALIEGGMHRMDRKQNVDKVAAAIILQQYLDAAREQAAQAAHEEEAAANPEDVLEFENEDGSVFRCRLLARIAHADRCFAVLTEEGADDPFVLEIVPDEEDSENPEYYASVDDDELVRTILDLFYAQE